MGGKMNQNSIINKTKRTQSMISAKKIFSDKNKKLSYTLAFSLIASNYVHALTFDELQGLTYLQVKGSGLANTCPIIEGGSTNPLDLPVGDYSFDKFCMEPTSFKVKEESQFKAGISDFLDTKLMTRLTYTLDDMSGKIKISSGGKVTFI